jgi:hypothetical protein
MDRQSELALTVCILDLSGVSENATETALDTLNVRISATLQVDLRDYVRSVDDALTLVPKGWGGEIKWTDTLQQSSVVLWAPNSDASTGTHKLVSHALRDGVEVHYALPVAICLAALKVHLHVRKRAKPSRDVAT